MSWTYKRTKLAKVYIRWWTSSGPPDSSGWLQCEAYWELCWWANDVHTCYQTCIFINQQSGLQKYDANGALCGYLWWRVRDWKYCLCFLSSSFFKRSFRPAALLPAPLRPQWHFHCASRACLESLTLLFVFEQRRINVQRKTWSSAQFHKFMKNNLR